MFLIAVLLCLYRMTQSMVDTSILDFERRSRHQAKYFALRLQTHYAGRMGISLRRITYPALLILHSDNYEGKFETSRPRVLLLRNLNGTPLPARKDSRIWRKFSTAAMSRLYSRLLSSPATDSKQFRLVHLKRPLQVTVG
jgi:hypothetical protein